MNVKLSLSCSELTQAVTDVQRSLVWQFTTASESLSRSGVCVSCFKCAKENRLLCASAAATTAILAQPHLTGPTIGMPCSHQLHLLLRLLLLHSGSQQQHRSLVFCQHAQRFSRLEHIHNNFSLFLFSLARLGCNQPITQYKQCKSCNRSNKDKQ
jgi:hypothetical protein